MAINSTLFSLGPRIRRCGRMLVATTGWRFRVLTLGTILRRIVVDVPAKTVRIQERYGWLYRRARNIRFHDIQSVLYGYDDWSFHPLAWTYDSYDSFAVGLRLYDDREIGLFHFIGDGAFTNDSEIFPDWCYWSEFAFDLVGTQQQESRVFVELLSRMIGVTVEPPRT